MFGKILLFISCLILTSNYAAGQNNDNLPQVSAKLGKGVSIIAPDSSLGLNFSTIIQPRLTALANLSKTSYVQGTAFMRRLRFRFEGFVINPKLTYFIQLGVTNQDMESNRNPTDDNPGVLFDSYFSWEFAPKTQLIAGQFKIPGNRSRLMSFQGLNFPERSNAESVFTMYRDVGLQLKNEWSIGNVYLREAFALTGGEGRNRATEKGGYHYSGRFEVLPLGLFKNNGDYSEPDLAYEKSTKIAAAVSYSFNNDARRNRSVLGKDLYTPTDINTLSADIIVKYQGLSLFVEYYNRSSQYDITYNKDSTLSQYVYNGTGYSGNLSYVINNDYAVALRYSYVKPIQEIFKYVGTRKDVTIGVTKYIAGNAVKLVACFNYAEEDIPKTGFKKTLEFVTNIIIAL